MVLTFSAKILNVKDETAQKTDRGCRLPDKRYARAGSGTNNGSSGQSGLSLLEVLILIGLLVCLLAYLYPGIEAGRRAQRRVQAQAALLSLAQSLETFKARTGSYAGAAGSRAQPRAEGSPWLVSAEVPGDGAQTHYRLRIANANVQGFELRAVPVGSQVKDACGTLTLTAQGVRGMLNARPERRRADCWPVPQAVELP